VNCCWGAPNQHVICRGELPCAPFSFNQSLVNHSEACCSPFALSNACLQVRFSCEQAHCSSDTLLPHHCVLRCQHWRMHRKVCAHWSQRNSRPGSTNCMLLRGTAQQQAGPLVPHFAALHASGQLCTGKHTLCGVVQHRMIAGSECMRCNDTCVWQVLVSVDEQLPAVCCSSILCWRKCLRCNETSS
jgi:hypothetical protein